MTESTLPANGGLLSTIRSLLRSLLDKQILDAILLPVTLPAGNVAPSLLSNPASLDHADPLAPLLPINAARAASNLTLTPHPYKLGLVLRSCEIRALVELVKFKQANLDNALIIGIDCLGTYTLKDYQTLQQATQDDHSLSPAALIERATAIGLPLRTACQICEHPIPDGHHLALSIGFLGLDPNLIYLKARDDIAQSLGLTATPPPPARSQAIHQLIAARTQARDAAFLAFHSQVNSIDALLSLFSPCIRCHNCMTNCPICYCRECIFRTPTFEHDSQLFFQWAQRKDSVRMLPDSLLFHLTRLNHMATSCIGCGICTDACPVDIPVASAFRAIGHQVQALFDYHPGRSLDEPAPVQEFREDELATLGERPH